MEISLRAAAESDSDFIERVYFETQRWIIERLFGWRGDEFEHRRFLEHYHPADTRIVEVNGNYAGWLTVTHTPECADVRAIYLLPEFQNRGIGTHLIQDVIAGAATQRLAVRLETAKINPARSLYERLGFVVVGENEFKIFMMRPLNQARAD